MQRVITHRVIPILAIFLALLLLLVLVGLLAASPTRRESFIRAILPGLSGWAEQEGSPPLPSHTPARTPSPTLGSAPPVILTALPTHMPPGPTPTIQIFLAPSLTPTLLPDVPSDGVDRWTSPRDGMTLIRIPAGTFLMGSDTSPWDFERPQHTVSLDEYWIDRLPVSNAQFSRFVTTTNYITQAERIGWGYVSPGQGENQTNGANWQHPTGPTSSIAGQDNYPVVQVSWNDAKAYCTWAGRRLLTEAEWEKAARGSDGRAYPWGSEIDCTQANYSNGSKSYCTGGLTPVDAYPNGASPYDVLDMAGNTFDWVADWYQPNYYRSAPIQNPTGPSSGTKRVHRGGAWYNFDLQVQTSYRYANPPDFTFGSVGIRCGYSK